MKDGTFQKRDLRTLLGLAFSFACLLIMLAMVGCAPEVKERQYGQGRKDFGPLQKDADLGLAEIANGKDVNHSLLEWAGEIDSARLFRASETLISLGEIRGSKRLVETGRKMGRAFYAVEGSATRTSFGNSLYVSAIVGETKTDSLAKIDENDEMLSRQTALLTKIASDVGTKFPWPRAGASAREIFDAVEAFIDTFVAATGKVIEPEIQDAMVKSLNKKFFPLIRDVRLETESIFQEPRSLDIIKRFRDLAKRNELELGPESTKQLQDAEVLMTKIEEIKKSHHVLTVLVMIWEQMDQQTRDTKFKNVSEDLYDYLNGKDSGQLACIKDPDCKRPFVWLQKELGIKPAIEKQGIDNVRNQIATEARASLIEEIQVGVAEVAPEIPTEVGKRIVAEITDIRTKLAGIRKDYGSFVRRIADGYANKSLLSDAGKPSSVVGFEAARIRVGIGKNRLNLSPADRGDDSVATGAEAIGTSMALASALWKHEPAGSLFYKRSVLSQVNKLLSISGFESEGGKPFPSLAIAVDPTAKKRHFYIRDFSSSPTGYVVPDALRVAKDASTTFDSKQVDASVRGQAELLRGLSALIRSFRDWEKSPFDEALGKVAIGELITEMPAEGLTQKLFPKDTFFALSVGNAGAILSNMTKTLSPVFLVGTNNKVVWSNDLETTDDGDPTTIAGVVDIVAGKRADSVRTKNVARFLLAVAEFLEATEGIERTKSDVLLEKGANGKSPIDQLVDAREDIKLLALGLANFLSNQVQQKDGGFRASYNQAKIEAQANEPRTLIDQALGVMALARVGDALDKDIYRWAAMDGLAFMNRVLWNPKVGFYRSVEGTDTAPSFDEVTAALMAGERIRVFLPEKSRAQWDRLAGPWYTAFEEL
ncbi:MAG: hypothetical protein V4760_02495 [Bdellovibrionota bacterium]